jgi:hypothetical protein
MEAMVDKGGRAEAAAMPPARPPAATVAAAAKVGMAAMAPPTETAAPEGMAGEAETVEDAPEGVATEGMEATAVPAAQAARLRRGERLGAVGPGGLGAKAGTAPGMAAGRGTVETADPAARAEFSPDRCKGATGRAARTAALEGEGVGGTAAAEGRVAAPQAL